MPELPEVQTVVSDLNKKIKGHIVAGFWSDWPKAIKGKGEKRFEKEIIGRKILGARRIGKNLFIDLSGGKTLYIHLKMTGHLLVKSEIRNPKSETPSSKAGLATGQANSKSQIPNLKSHNYFDDKVNSYIHHIWYLKTQNAKRVTVEFSDVRKFAKIVLDDTEKIKNLKEIKALGVDAMSPEFSLQKFAEILGHPKPLSSSPLRKGRGVLNRPVGLVLMEQEKIAGIGNIYRSEILFDAGIDPRRKSVELSKDEKKKIYNATKKILKKAIKMRGTSDSDYRDTSGAPGNFHKILKVYKKSGQKCTRCGTIIKRIKMGQRSVFFCPLCQK
jgi:formamidopyrimidine-DNA glycosylase